MPSDGANQDPGELAESRDPVPGEVVARAKGLFSGMRAKKPPAVLRSPLDPLEADHPASRTLRFDHPDLTLSVRVASRGPERQLEVHVHPPGPVTVEVRGPSSTIATGVSAHGVVHFPWMPRGMVRLRVECAGAAMVQTEAFDL